MSGNTQSHCEKLRDVTTVNTEPSLQNALELAKNMLKSVPSYGSREVKEIIVS